MTAIQRSPFFSALESTRRTAATSRIPGTLQPAFGNQGTKAMQGIAGNRFSKLLKAFDLEDVKEWVAEKLLMAQVVYGTCISSRIAFSRSGNERRETALRDSLGFICWFFATPLMQRLFLRLAPSKEISNTLIAQTPKPKDTGSLLGKLKLLSWHINPLSKWRISGTQQLKDLEQQAMAALERGAEDLPKTEALLEKLKQAREILNKHYKSAIRWRNLATLLGIGVTAAGLGIGINVLNMKMTAERVAKERAAVTKASTGAPAAPGPAVR